MSVVRAFEISVAGPGTAYRVVVDLPTAWARRHERVALSVRPWLQLVGDGGECVLDFPWHEESDGLAGLPIALDDGKWFDLEESWWASVTDVDGVVYVAESDLGALSSLRPPLDVRCERPGKVLVDGVDVVWSSVSRAAYDAAWRAFLSS